MVQQVLDENGVLTHVIMSQAGPPPPHHVVRIEWKRGSRQSFWPCLFHYSIPVILPRLITVSMLIHITIHSATDLIFQIHYLIRHARPTVIHLHPRIVGSRTNQPCSGSRTSILLLLLASQCLFHPSDSNGFSSSTAGNTSMTANATNPSNHHRRRSPVYNASNNSCPAMGTGGSHGRGLNNGGSKRRLTASHGHTNSYVNNTGMSKSICFA